MANEINFTSTATDNTISFDSSSDVFTNINFTGQVSEGPQGPIGPQGPAGPIGESGVGIASGGNTGDLLAKTSNDDYDTAFIDPASLPISDETQSLLDAAVADLEAAIAAVTIPDATPTVSGKSKMIVYNVRDYGAVGDGTTDDTAAINAAIAAACTAGGGQIYIPTSSGKYRCDGAIVIPYTGTYFEAVQAPLRIFGDGANWNGRWKSLYVTTGSILDLRYDGSDGLHPAKIDTRGAGYLEIDNLTMVSGGSDSFTFIQTTNTTVFIHNNAVQGNPTKSGPNCEQDFMHFGGITAGTVSQSGTTITGVGTAFTSDMVGCTIAYNGQPSSTKAIITAYVSPTQLTTSLSQTIASTTWGISTPCNIAMSPFQGYGSKMENNYYGRIQHAARFGNYTNNITIQNETFSTSCGSNDPVLGCAYLMAPSFSSVGGNTISGCTIEAGSYAYPVVLGGEGFCYTNHIDFIGIYDDHGDTYGVVYCGATAYYNQITTGWFNSSLQPNYVAGPNKIYQNITSASQNMMNYSYVGYWSNNYIARNITTVNPDLPNGTNMNIRTGSGGSNLGLESNSLIVKDKDGNTMSTFKNSASAKGVYQLAGGTTANRPSASSVGAGSIWFDTTLGRKITSDGTSWIVSPDDAKVVHNTGDTITIPVGGNAAALTLRQNDTTNNPKGLLIVQAAAAIGLDIAQQNNGQALRIVHNDSSSGGNLAALDIVRTANSASLVRGISVSATNAGAGGVRAIDVTGGVKADNLSAGNVSTPTAKVHIAAGSATANTAPLKFTSGTNLTTPEAGAMEWDGSNLYVTQTSGPTRKTIAFATPITEVTGTSQSMAVNNRYIANNAALVTLTLPSNAAVGDQVIVRGKGAGLWKVAQNIGQVIHGATDTTTGTGGSLTAQTRYDCVTLECITANTDFLIINQRGTLTTV